MGARESLLYVLSVFGGGRANPAQMNGINGAGSCMESYGLSFSARENETGRALLTDEEWGDGE